jgi:hypothetical protein
MTGTIIVKVKIGPVVDDSSLFGAFIHYLKEEEEGIRMPVAPS